MDPSDVFWRQRSWWAKTGRTYVGVFAATGFAFLATLVAARGLGPSRFGAAILALSVAELAATFLDLTLEEAVVHYGAVSLARKDFAELRGLLRAAIVLDVVIGIGVFAVIVAAADPLARLIGGGAVDGTLVRVAAIGGLCTGVGGASGAALLLAGKPDVRAATMAGSSLIRLLCVSVAISAFRSPLSFVLAVVIGAGLGSAALILVAWRFAWRQWAEAPQSAGVRDWVRRLIRFGIHTSVTTSATAAKKALVSVLLGAVAGVKAVGVFDVAIFPVTVVQTASAPIRLSLMPTQAELWAHGRGAELRRSVWLYARLALVIGIPGAVLGWFLLPVLLPALYSTAFTVAVTPARILLLAAVALLTTGWSKPLAAAIGRPQARTKMALVDLGVVSALVLWFGRYGATGAAWAVSISAAVVAVGWWVYAERYLLRGQVQD